MRSEDGNLSRVDEFNELPSVEVSRGLFHHLQGALYGVDGTGEVQLGAEGHATQTSAGCHVENRPAPRQSNA